MPHFLSVENDQMKYGQNVTTHCYNRSTSVVFFSLSSAMAVTEAAVSLQDLLDYLEIQECHLKKRCNDEHVREVALLIDKWEVYASHLGLTQTEIDSIKEDGRANEEKKILALQKWKTKNAFKATFKVLIQMFLKAGNAELAEKVAIMLKKEIGMSTEFCMGVKMDNNVILL